MAAFCMIWIITSSCMKRRKNLLNSRVQRKQERKGNQHLHMWNTQNQYHLHLQEIIQLLSPLFIVSCTVSVIGVVFTPSFPLSPKLRGVCIHSEVAVYVHEQGTRMPVECSMMQYAGFRSVIQFDGTLINVISCTHKKSTNYLNEFS